MNFANLQQTFEPRSGDEAGIVAIAYRATQTNRAEMIKVEMSDMPTWTRILRGWD